MKRKTIIYIPYWIKNSKTNQYTLNMIKLLQEQYSIIGDLAEPFELEKMLHIKAVYLNWIEQDLDIKMKIQILLHKFFGAKIIWVFHNKYPHDVPKEDGVSRNINWLADHSSNIVLHSKSSIKFLPNSAQNKKKAIYIPHLLYESQYRDINFDKFREDYGIDKSDFVFLIFGRIRPYKNIESGIKAFQKLNLQHAKLIIAGKPSDNKYAERLKHFCKNDSNIILCLQYVPDIMLENLIDISDVIVMPYMDGSSMNSGVMIQAFSNGKTVIAPDICMARDMAKEKFFYMYKNSLSNVMMKAYRNGKNKNKVMGEHAREYMLRHNNWKEVRKKVYGLLEE